MAIDAQMHTSHALIERIEHYIQSRTNGMVRDLTVDIFEREVVISGRTTTYYTKQLATHAVLGTLADVDLKNNIEVY
jgi:hypothetical protein